MKIKLPTWHPNFNDWYTLEQITLKHINPDVFEGEGGLITDFGPTCNSGTAFGIFNEGYASYQNRGTRHERKVCHDIARMDDAH